MNTWSRTSVMLTGALAFFFVVFSGLSFAASRINLRTLFPAQNLGVSGSPAALLGLPETGLERVRETTDDKGNKASRYVQMFRGLPVWGEQVVVHTDTSGAIRKIRGNLLRGLSLDIDTTDPFPDLNEAIASGLMRTRFSKDNEAAGEWVFEDEATRRVVYRRDDGTAVVAFAVSFSAQTPDQRQHARPVYIADAFSASVLQYYDRPALETNAPASALIPDGESGDILMSFYDIVSRQTGVSPFTISSANAGSNVAQVAGHTEALVAHTGKRIFSKAFYTLADSDGWDPQKAFAVFDRANRDYWAPSTTFLQGAMDVYESAADLGFKPDDVAGAFRVVGIKVTGPHADMDYAQSHFRRKVTFTNLSYDITGDITAYSWDFGDGTTSANAAPSHTYKQNGTYTVTLTAQNDTGKTHTAETSITVSKAMCGATPVHETRTAGHNMRVFLPLIPALFCLGIWFLAGRIRD